MAYKINDPAAVAVEPRPHPAASPFDKRVSEVLGIKAFEVYRVELPPNAETVRHDHLDDGVEDLYFIVPAMAGPSLTKNPYLFIRDFSSQDSRVHKTTSQGPFQSWLWGN